MNHIIKGCKNWDSIEKLKESKKNLWVLMYNKWNLITYKKRNYYMISSITQYLLDILQVLLKFF